MDAGTTADEVDAVEADVLEECSLKELQDVSIWSIDRRTEGTHKVLK